MHLLSQRVSLGKEGQPPYTLSVEGIAFLELLQYPDFNLASVTVLGYGPDDFNSNLVVRPCVDSLHHLAKGALAK